MTATDLLGTIANNLDAPLGAAGPIQRRVAAFKALRKELRAGREPDWAMYPRAAQYVHLTLAQGHFKDSKPPPPPDPVEALKRRLVDYACQTMLQETDEAALALRQVREEALEAGLSKEEVYDLAMTGFQRAHDGAS